MHVLVFINIELKNAPWNTEIVLIVPGVRNKHSAICNSVRYITLLIRHCRLSCNMIDHVRRLDIDKWSDISCRNQDKTERHWSKINGLQSVSQCGILGVSGRSARWGQQTGTDCYWKMSDLLLTEIAFLDLCDLTHCGRVTQICVFTLQLCKTDDENLRF